MLHQPLIFFYSDKECENQIFSVFFDGVTLVGNKSVPKTVWAKNISGNELLRVEIHIIDKVGNVEEDVTVEPSLISYFTPDSIEEITFVFHPSATRTEPLKGEIQVSCVMIKRV